MNILHVQDIHAGYGGVNILNGIDLHLPMDKIGVVVGPNGAGKSTTLKAIFGLLRVSAGSILLDGDNITNIAPEKLVSMGMGFVPQDSNVFETLTVQENLEMGAFIRRDDISQSLDYIYSLFPPLTEKRNQPAGELSGGQRQMVAMGRALMSKPRLLLLDEPTAGLSPRYMNEIFVCIQTINEQGIGILMVEQNARQALAIAHIGVVLASGRNRFTDSGAALLANPDVAKSFLGG